MYDLSNRSIIVTGGGSGIGREAALQAALAGACVTVADLSEEGASVTVDAIRQAGGKAQYVRADIALEADVRAVVQAAISKFGKLDAAFNNAAIPQVGKALTELESVHFNRALQINVIGTFLCMKYEILSMQETGGGAIVNTASVAGIVGTLNGAEYVASKHAVIGLTKAAALEYSDRNIRINALLPGATMTPMLETAIANDDGLEAFIAAQQPIGRLARPAEMASAAVWLLSDHASFITGSSIPVDGGYTAK